MENVLANVFVLSCLNLHESTKTFHVFLHLVPPLIPHYIVMVKSLLLQINTVSISMQYSESHLTSDLPREVRVHAVDLAVEVFSDDLFLLLRLGRSQRLKQLLLGGRGRLVLLGGGAGGRHGRLARGGGKLHSTGRAHSMATGK